jgi:hypothetical protein
MNFLGLLLIVLIYDRAIPAGAGRYSVSALKSDIDGAWREYGLIRFPRTLLGAGVCFCGCLLDFFPNSRDEIGLAGILLMLGFVIAAAWDAWRAFIHK